MTMTYGNDPNRGMGDRRLDNEGMSATSLVVAGLVAVVVIFGIMFMAGDRTTNDTASNSSPATTSRPATTPPATTGSGVPTAPASR
jgi:hypothetical protein